MASFVHAAKAKQYRNCIQYGVNWGVKNIGAAIASISLQLGWEQLCTDPMQVIDNG